MTSIEYNGLYVKDTGINSVAIWGIKDINLKHIFECGQSFRWIKRNEQIYEGVVFGKEIIVRYDQNILEIINSNLDDFKNIWFDYFDLGRDYSIVKKELEQKDSILKEAVRFGYGIRLLKQDIWEILISFILSANNNIPRIMKSIELLCQLYGTRVKDRHMFPTPEVLAKLSIKEIEKIRCGFRAKYIHGAANMVYYEKINLSKVKELNTVLAKAELMKIPGVGHKIADCILLFSCSKYDVFPKDVWIKRIIEEIYFKKEVSMKEIEDFADNYFGNLKGFAQQYLFYYAREKRIGCKK